jgi:hypothetical protein
MLQLITVLTVPGTVVVVSAAVVFGFRNCASLQPTSYRAAILARMLQLVMSEGCHSRACGPSNRHLVRNYVNLPLFPVTVLNRNLRILYHSPETKRN